MMMRGFSRPRALRMDKRLHQVPQMATFFAKRKTAANGKKDGDKEDRFDVPPGPARQEKARLAAQKKPRTSAPGTFI